MRFWYRTSPRPLLPLEQEQPGHPGDPPLQVNGMTTHPRYEGPAAALRVGAAAGRDRRRPRAARVDWKLFAAAEFDLAAFTEAAPSRTPSTYADERKAWTGTLPETKIPVRIEAAGYRGRPVLFEIVTPWTPAPRDPGRAGRPGGNNPLFIYVLLGGAALAAWANVRRGRADKHGAFRLAAFTFFLMIAIWLVNPHVDDVADEQQRFFIGVGLSALRRRRAVPALPRTRAVRPPELADDARQLVAACWRAAIRDPLIGRDILIGAAIGASLALRTSRPTSCRRSSGCRSRRRTRPTSARSSTRAASSSRSSQRELRPAERAHLGVRVRGDPRRFRMGDAQRRALERPALGWAGKLAMSEKTSERVFVVLVISVIGALHVLGERSGPARG